MTFRDKSLIALDHTTFPLRLFGDERLPSSKLESYRAELGEKMRISRLYWRRELLRRGLMTELHPTSAGWEPPAPQVADGFRMYAPPRSVQAQGHSSPRKPVPMIPGGRGSLRAQGWGRSRPSRPRLCPRCCRGRGGGAGGRSRPGSPVVRPRRLRLGSWRSGVRPG